MINNIEQKGEDTGQMGCVLEGVKGKCKDWIKEKEKIEDKDNVGNGVSGFTSQGFVEVESKDWDGDGMDNPET